jgi:predicted transcriptional regulator
MAEDILTINVSDNLQSSLSRAVQMMEQLENNVEPEPYFAVGFKNFNQMLAVFSPLRWDLLATLREQGAVSVVKLAKILQRDEADVEADVKQLMEWLVIQCDEQGHVFTPYAEIVVDVHLPQQKAA